MRRGHIKCLSSLVERHGLCRIPQAHSHVMLTIAIHVLAVMLDCRNKSKTWILYL